MSQEGKHRCVIRNLVLACRWSCDNCPAKGWGSWKRCVLAVVIHQETRGTEKDWSRLWAGPSARA